MDRLPIWFDAVGFTYHRHKHLHAVDVASGVVSQLTGGEFNLVCSAPSNQGRLIAYAASTEELDPRKTDLFPLRHRIRRARDGSIQSSRFPKQHQPLALFLRDIGYWLLLRP